MPLFYFLYPLKTSQRFSVVFMEYRKTPVTSEVLLALAPMETINLVKNGTNINRIVQYSSCCAI